MLTSSNTVFRLVVSKMGSLAQSSNIQNFIKSTNKIPEYASDYEKEWLCIGGINKECGEFIERLDNDGNLFNSPRANHLKKFIRRFLRAEERGKIKDISGFYFKYYDYDKIIFLVGELDDYFELYVNEDGSYEFDKEYYELHIDRDYPGLKELFELVSLLNDKIKTKLNLSEFISNNRSFIDSVFNSFSDSDSD